MHQAGGIKPGDTRRRTRIWAILEQVEKIRSSVGIRQVLVMYRRVGTPRCRYDESAGTRNNCVLRSQIHVDIFDGNYDRDIDAIGESECYVRRILIDLKMDRIYRIYSISNKPTAIEI